MVVNKKATCWGAVKTGKKGKVASVFTLPPNKWRVKVGFFTLIASYCVHKYTNYPLISHQRCKKFGHYLNAAPRIFNVLVAFFVR